MLVLMKQVICKNRNHEKNSCQGFLLKQRHLHDSLTFRQRTLHDHSCTLRCTGRTREAQGQVSCSSAAKSHSTHYFLPLPTSGHTLLSLLESPTTSSPFSCLLLGDAAWHSGCHYCKQSSFSPFGLVSHLLPILVLMS